MVHQRSVSLTVAFGLFFGACLFVTDTTAQNATGLTCLICNDALGKEHECAPAAPDSKNATGFKCESLDDVKDAVQKLREWGTTATRRSGGGHGLEDLKMTTNYLDSVKMKHYEKENKVGFACRKYSVSIPEKDDNKNLRRTRSVGLCGVFIKHHEPHEHDDSKMECVTKAGSAKNSFTSCKCDKPNCNGAGRLSSKGINIMLSVGAISSLLLSTWKFIL